MHGMQALTRSRPGVASAVLVAAGGAATILGAYFFQYVMGLRPCIAAAGLGVIALAMLFNSGLALFHAGVEWKWWPGPQECSGPLTDLSAGGDLLSSLTNLTIVRCDEAAWRFLGLSLAGYDVLISLALAAIAAWGTTAAWRAMR